MADHVTAASNPVPVARRKEDVAQVLRGLCMGAADVVPGVSGGTVALILGIYGRLVTAISHIDLELLRLLRAGRFRDAARHLDLRFLLTLGLGIAGGFLIMTALMHHLLTQADTRAWTLAAFFGMILASAVLVGALIRIRRALDVLTTGALMLLGGGLAYWLTTLPVARVEPSYGYLFVCGAIAICAMILPGISGAMVLLIMGVYVYLTEIPSDLLHGREVVHGLLTVAVFGSGCAIGLVSFSKVLRWLLHAYHSVTMAVLCGFMLGALRKIWPFQKDVTPDQHDFKLKEFELYWPTEWDSLTGSVILVMVLAAAAIFAVDFASRRLNDRHDRHAESG